MAIKYNDLANTTSIATSQPTFDSDTDDDYMVDCQRSSDAEEIGMELDAIETEMIALLNISSESLLGLVMLSMFVKEERRETNIIWHASPSPIH